VSQKPHQHQSAARRPRTVDANQLDAVHHENGTGNDHQRAESSPENHQAHSRSPIRRVRHDDESSSPLGREGARGVQKGVNRTDRKKESLHSPATSRKASHSPLQKASRGGVSQLQMTRSCPDGEDTGRRSVSPGAQGIDTSFLWRAASYACTHDASTITLTPATPYSYGAARPKGERRIPKTFQIPAIRPTPVR